MNLDEIFSKETMKQGTRSSYYIICMYRVTVPYPSIYTQQVSAHSYNNGFSLSFLVFLYFTFFFAFSEYAFISRARAVYTKHI